MKNPETSTSTSEEKPNSNEWGDLEEEKPSTPEELETSFSARLKELQNHHIPMSKSEYGKWEDLAKPSELASSDIKTYAGNFYHDRLFELRNAASKTNDAQKDPTKLANDFAISIINLIDLKNTGPVSEYEESSEEENEEKFQETLEHAYRNAIRSFNDLNKTAKSLNVRPFMAEELYMPERLSKTPESDKERYEDSKEALVKYAALAFSYISEKTADTLLKKPPLPGRLGTEPKRETGEALAS